MEIKEKVKGENTKVGNDLQMPEVGYSQGKDVYKNLFPHPAVTVLQMTGCISREEVDINKSQFTSMFT